MNNEADKHRAVSPLCMNYIKEHDYIQAANFKSASPNLVVVFR